MKSTKIYSGCYNITVNNREFSLERMSAIVDDGSRNNDNTWMLCEIINGNKEYWNHFQYKWQAMEAIERNVY